MMYPRYAMSLQKHQENINKNTTNVQMYKFIFLESDPKCQHLKVLRIEHSIAENTATPWESLKISRASQWP